VQSAEGATLSSRGRKAVDNDISGVWSAEGAAFSFMPGLNAGPFGLGSLDLRFTTALRPRLLNAAPSALMNHDP